MSTPSTNTRAAAATAAQHDTPVVALSTACIAAVLASLLTAAAIGAGPAGTRERPAVAAPYAPAAAAVVAPASNGVPDAATVFSGRDLPDEEPAPTF